MSLRAKIEERRLAAPCGCGQAIGAGGHHTVELHERHEQNRRPWQTRATAKDLTGAPA